jgi:hypothetical protein
LPSRHGTENNNPASVYLGEVQYIDYETDWLPDSSLFYPVIHKRKSFEHERELRALFLDSPEDPLTTNNLQEGYRVEVSLDDLIEAVYVAPTALDWFRDLVGAVKGKYGFAHKPIIRSSLGKDPAY